MWKKSLPTLKPPFLNMSPSRNNLRRAFAMIGLGVTFFGAASAVGLSDILSDAVASSTVRLEPLRAEDVTLGEETASELFMELLRKADRAEGFLPPMHTALDCKCASESGALLSSRHVHDHGCPFPPQRLRMASSRVWTRTGVWRSPLPPRRAETPTELAM